MGSLMAVGSPLSEGGASEPTAVGLGIPLGCTGRSSATLERRRSDVAVEPV